MPSNRSTLLLEKASVDSYSASGSSHSGDEYETDQEKDACSRNMRNLVIAISFVIAALLLIVSAVWWQTFPRDTRDAKDGLGSRGQYSQAPASARPGGPVSKVQQHQHEECSKVEEFGGSPCSKEVHRLIADSNALWEYSLTPDKFYTRTGDQRWVQQYPKTFAWYPISTSDMRNEEVELPSMLFEDLQFLIHMKQPKEELCPLPCFGSPKESTASSEFLSPPFSSNPSSFSANASCPPKPAKPGPPNDPQGYNGISWPSMCFEGLSEEHVFIIGDWGGALPGTPADNTPNKGRPFVHGLDDTAQLLVAQQFIKRAKAKDPGYILNVGDNFYIGGCNEYCSTGSMEDYVKAFSDANNSNSNTRNCTNQFYAIFETMYMGPGVNGKPWISCLGNHDYGGFYYDAAWDQQVAYTWGPSGRWVLPALYYHQHVSYPTKGFTVDYYVLDTNIADVGPAGANPTRNPCSNSRKQKNCHPFGPRDPEHCVTWFTELWNTQIVWLEKMLSKSVAEWQIILTHFPPESQIWHRASMPMFHELKRIGQQYGVDLIITGHRHIQTLYESGRTGWCETFEIPYVVSGGGGGMTADFLPADAGDCHWSGKDSLTCDTTHGPDVTSGIYEFLKKSPAKECDDPALYYVPPWQTAKWYDADCGHDMYGFMDMTISKTEIKIEALNHRGINRGTMMVKPRGAE